MSRAETIEKAARDLIDLIFPGNAPVTGGMSSLSMLLRDALALPPDPEPEPVDPSTWSRPAAQTMSSNNANAPVTAPDPTPVRPELARAAEPWGTKIMSDGSTSAYTRSGEEIAAAVLDALTLDDLPPDHPIRQRAERAEAALARVEALPDRPWAQDDADSPESRSARAYNHALLQARRALGGEQP